jgi:hypothetical protein
MKICSPQGRALADKVVMKPRPASLNGWRIAHDDRGHDGADGAEQRVLRR